MAPDVRARRDHGLDVLEFQSAVLHFEPGVVVVLGGFAVTGNIERGLREAEDLLAFQEFLLGRVVERRLRLWAALLRQYRRAQKGDERNQSKRG